MIPEDAASAQDTVTKAFSLLCEPMQQQLWRMQWRSLRPVQVDTIRAWNEHDRPLLVMAETAGGKTEAAFLPILSSIANEPTGSVRALYVGPLKALINDQFRRVEELCGYLEMPVHRWHGDVGQASKDDLRENPGGVLLITPESLESLFVNHAPRLPRLFGGLRAVVIDEVHAFLGTERGQQLASLLLRLRRYVSTPSPRPRTVGLSATIGDVNEAARLLDIDAPERVAIVRSSGDAQETRLRIHGYVVSKSESTDGDDGKSAASWRLAEDLVEHTRSRATLVFANRRSDVEEYADLARQIAQRESLPDAYLVHHGSLAKDLREDAEKLLKDGHPVTVFCSSTLELGVDIGSVAMVGQIGATWSVASFRQRLGRSGRRGGEPRQIRVYIEEHDPRELDDDVAALPLGLLQSIALVELMLEGFIEPLRQSRCDLSTLSQQIMSVIVEHGGIDAATLFERLCPNGAFRDIDRETFVHLLRDLGKAKIVEQAPEGHLLLGSIGERIRESKDFYAVFATEKEFRVRWDGKTLGTLPALVPPMENDSIIFAGRRWTVLAVLLEEEEIRVAPGHGKKPASFHGGGGSVHPRVREKMREVLGGRTEFPYVDKTAAWLLERARERCAHLARRHVLRQTNDRTMLLTWTGTRIQTTLAGALRVCGLRAWEGQVSVEVGGSFETVRVALETIAAGKVTVCDVAQSLGALGDRKYDRFLSAELKAKSLERDVVDLEGALEVVGMLLETNQPRLG